jgi:hypothetical protein
MGSSKIKGTNFKLEDGIIYFFGSSGMHTGKGGWAVNIFASTPDVHTPPQDAPSEIRTIIAGDVADGNGDRIAMLLVSPEKAVLLYLGGQITDDLLRHATGKSDRVDIPGFKIDGRALAIRVMKGLDFEIATADSSGTVI